MIIVAIQVSEWDSDRAIQLEAIGFNPRFEREAFNHKEALGNILLGNSSWSLVVSEVSRYLMTHCYHRYPNWSIRVLRGGSVIRRIDSSLPTSDEVVEKVTLRVSRYARTPVI